MNEQENNSSNDSRFDGLIPVNHQSSVEHFDIYVESRFDDKKKSDDRDVSVERLNELLYENSISPREHSFLLQKLFSTEKFISKFSWLCLACAIISWVSFMTFSYGETKYQFMSGENRMRVVTFFVPFIVLFFYLAIREIRNKPNVKGFEIALVGLTIAVAQSTLMIPGWLMYFYAIYFE